MQRIIGMLILLGVIWAGSEIYGKGMDGAFGGVLAAPAAPGTQSLSSAPDRAADAFQRAYDSSEKRVDAALEKQ